MKVDKRTERRAARGDEHALAETLSRDMAYGKLAKREVVAAATLGHPVAQRVTGLGAFDDPYHGLLAVEDSWLLASIVLACARLVRPALLGWAAGSGVGTPNMEWAIIGAWTAVQRQRALRWDDPQDQGKGDDRLHMEVLRRLVRLVRGDYGTPRPMGNEAVVAESVALCCAASFHFLTEPERRAWLVRACAEATARIVADVGHGMHDPAEGDLMAVDASMQVVSMLSSRADEETPRLDALEHPPGRFVRRKDVEARPAPPMNMRFARFGGWAQSGAPEVGANLGDGARLGQRLAKLVFDGTGGPPIVAWLPLSCFKVEPGLCSSSGVSRSMAEAILPGYVAAMR